MRGAGLIAALAIAGCAAAPTRTPQTAPCRDYLESLDAQIDRAGVRDAGAHRVDGFPYLRSDRFTASFVSELADEPRLQLWLELLRQRDVDARRVEIANLGTPDASAVLRKVEECGRTLVQFELADPPARSRVRRNAVVPSEYSATRKALGLYPLAVPFLRMGIRSYHREVEADFEKPVDALEHPGTLVRWDPESRDAPPTSDVKEWLAKTDVLGIPKLTAAQWQRLAQAHAPTWWVEQGGDYDRPGAPVVGATPRVDRERPVVYFQSAYTRFAGKVLVQLAYTVWFSERPSSTGAAYAGALDGVVWRVTLDADGQPMLYDTIHSCGCYRYYLPVWPAVRKPEGVFWQERALFPQREVPKGVPVAVRLQSGTHYVRRVVTSASVRADKTQRYKLEPYAELLSLKSGDDKRRSLFDEDGIVAGSQRPERYWLWVSGVPDAGAMRQWGRHPTAFVGRSHFDDPDFLDALFEVPVTTEPVPVE